MSIEDQRRTMVPTRVVAGSLSMTEAATLLGVSERSAWRAPNGASGRRTGRAGARQPPSAAQPGAWTTPFERASGSWQPSSC